MIKIEKCKEHNHKAIVSASGGIFELVGIIDLLTITEIKENRKTGGKWKETSQFYTRYTPNSIIINKGYVEFLQYILSIKQVPYEIDVLEFLVDPIDVTKNDKWSRILSNDEYALNGVTQLEYLTRLLSDKYGIGFGKFATGYGKTELQLAIVETFQESKEGNALIFVPTGVIGDNFAERAKQWDVKTKTLDNTEAVPLKFRFDTNKRINIINPTGLMSSSVIKEKEVIEYLKNVKLIVIDEAHHLSADTWYNLIMNYCPNVEFLYGFSGSPDKNNHKVPTWLTAISGDTPNKWSVSLAKIFSLTGLVKSQVSGSDLKKDVIIWNIEGSFSKIPDEEKGEYNAALDYTFLSETFAQRLAHFLNFHKRTYFMMVHKVSTGKLLRENLIRLGMLEHEVLFISAGEYHPHFNSIGEFKEHIENNDVKVIISSVVAIEGFDSKKISGSILSAGKNVRFALQVLGRSRSADTHCVFLYDKGNPMLMKQSREKTRTVKLEFGQNIKETRKWI